MTNRSGPWTGTFARRLCAGLALLLAGCAGLPAPDAALPWRDLEPGLAVASFQPIAASQLHVVRLDLREPTLRLRVSAPHERGRSIDRMEGAASAPASVNASFFDRAFTPRGVTVSEGEVWTPVLVPQASPLLACDASQHCEIHFDAPSAARPGWVNAVAGTPWLVREGRARDAGDDAACPALCARTHPRTAVGLDAGRRRLYVVLAEGRRAGVPGLTLSELARVMARLGIHDAINLDGGGSSALLLGGVAAMARPDNEPAQRALANVLQVVRRAP